MSMPKKLRIKKFCNCDFLAIYPYVHCMLNADIVHFKMLYPKRFRTSPKDPEQCKKLRQHKEGV